MMNPSEPPKRDVPGMRGIHLISGVYSYDSVTREGKINTFPRSSTTEISLSKAYALCGRSVLRVSEESRITAESLPV